jgi:uncharacterized membrane-anchored protein
MLQPPALLTALVLASVYAVLFYLVLGRSLRDLLFYWLASVVGFVTGQLVGQFLDVSPLTIGQVRVVEATLVAILFLLLARWITMEREKS